MRLEAIFCMPPLYRQCCKSSIIVSSTFYFALTLSFISLFLFFYLSFCFSVLLYLWCCLSLSLYLSISHSVSLCLLSANSSACLFSYIQYLPQMFSLSLYYFKTLLLLVSLYCSLSLFFTYIQI